MRDRVTVLAPAKLNLALDVVGILPGGYHALDIHLRARDVAVSVRILFEVVLVGEHLPRLQCQR